MHIEPRKLIMIQVTERLAVNCLTSSGWISLYETELDLYDLDLAWHFCPNRNDSYWQKFRKQLIHKGFIELTETDLNQVSCTVKKRLATQNIKSVVLSLACRNSRFYRDQKKSTNTDSVCSVPYSIEQG